jgi:hypothetical protein
VVRVGGGGPLREGESNGSARGAVADCSIMAGKACMHACCSSMGAVGRQQGRRGVIMEGARSPLAAKIQNLTRIRPQPRVEAASVSVSVAVSVASASASLGESPIAQCRHTWQGRTAAAVGGQGVSHNSPTLPNPTNSLATCPPLPPCPLTGPSSQVQGPSWRYLLSD